MEKFSEFIYYDNRNDIGTGDFSGKDSPLTALQRREFLAASAAYETRRAGLEGGSQKAVSKKEVSETVARLKTPRPRRVREIVYFDTMDAYHSAPASPKNGAGWRLYTDGAFTEGGALIFSDTGIPPVPCAKFETGGRGITLLEFEFFISEEYKAEQACKATVTTAGKTVELRSGCDECIRLQFYSGGNLDFRECENGCYHHKNINIAKDIIGAPHTLLLKIEGKGCEIYFDGVKKEGTFRLRNGGPPDTVFFSGGIHPNGAWRIKPRRLETAAGRPDKAFTDLSVPAARKDFSAKRKSLGKVSLPSAVGTEKFKDNLFILEADFKAAGGKRAALYIDSLDPCGRVKINGAEALRAADFLSRRADITGYLKNGKNKLELEIEPRAPQALYHWHRHRDIYNGWFSLGARVEFLPDAGTVSIRNVITRQIRNGFAEIEVRLRAETARAGFIKLEYEKIWPETGAPAFLESFAVSESQGEIVKSYVIKADAWSPETPNLYRVRAVLTDGKGSAADDDVFETGFRTVEQKDGALFLNGERVYLFGALEMQFPPPYGDIPVSHVCPSDEQIAESLLSLKKMNGNTLRLHQLGIGTNDGRFAAMCDKLGVMLIWTTRLIDSLESVCFAGEWKAKAAYQSQMRDVINHPSIIMWEGSNEFHASFGEIDKMYDSFVSAVKETDETRLICPCSHLYYGGGIYDERACQYYQDDGLSGCGMLPAKSSSGWTDGLVVRSAHTYCLLLGYGGGWDRLRLQDWKSQEALLESRSHAYFITEFSVIGRADNTTPEMRERKFADSYELPNEYDSLGFYLSGDEWRLSQAHQALCARHAVKRMRLAGADGLIWCCLRGGANDASYLKPVIDFYGYAKLAYYALRDAFAPVLCADASTDAVWGKEYVIRPVLLGGGGKKYRVAAEIKDVNGKRAAFRDFGAVTASSGRVYLEEWKPSLENAGFYAVEWTVEAESERSNNHNNQPNNYSNAYFDSDKIKTRK